MKKRVWSLVLSLCLLTAMLPVEYVAAKEEAGTERNPYRITEAGQLELLRGAMPGTYFRLEEDLILTGSWTPVGTEEAPFQGILLGEGHRVTGLLVEPGGSTAGFFGAIGAQGRVEGLGIEGAVAADGEKAGGLAGTCAGTIRACSFTGGVTMSGNGNGVEGGLVGELSGLLRDSWYRAGDSSGITAAAPYTAVGALVGNITASGAAYNCAAEGMVVAYSGFQTGGLAGSVSGGRLENCCHRGAVAAVGGSAGFLAGGVQGGGVVNCYWSAEDGTSASEAAGVGSVGAECRAFSSGGEILEELNAWVEGKADGYLLWAETESGLIPSISPVVKAEGSGTVTCQDITYGAAPSPLPRSDTNGIEQVTLLYRARDAAETDYSAQIPVKAGDYTVRAEFAETEAYFACSAEADFSIKKAPLEVAVGNHTIYLGDALPRFSVGYRGFVYGEDTSVLEGEVQIVCNADIDAPGTYPIVVSGLTAENYALRFTPGVLTVAELEAAPEGALRIPAPDGTEGWYTAPFTVEGAEGFAISERITGPFSEGKVLVSDDTAQGKKNIYLRDADGKKYMAQLEYQLDTEAPALAWERGTALLTEDAWYATARVEACAEDITSGVKRICLQVEKDYITQEIENGTELTEEGVYVVTALAEDEAGNSALLEKKTVQIEPLIGIFVQRVAALGDSASYTQLCEVKEWFDGLEAVRRERIAASREGSGALEALDARLGEFQPPEMVRQPADRSVPYGAAAGMLEVEARGKDLAYQWFWEGEAIEGAVEPVFLPPKGLGAGEYRCQCRVSAGRDGPETWSREAVIRVERAPLIVRSRPKTVSVGSTWPAFAVEYEGLIQGEDASVLKGTLVFQCEADLTKPGEYPILPGGLWGENYELTFLPAMLTVTAAEAAPLGAYRADAPDGKDGWYRKPFGLWPGEGYTIAGQSGGPYGMQPLLVEEEGADARKEVYLRDAEGTAYWGELYYRMDCTRPELAWAAGCPGWEEDEWVSGAVVALDAWDRLSGLAEVSILVRRGEAVEAVQESRVELVEEGVYSILGVAQDRAGNEARIGPIEVRVDPVIQTLIGKVAALRDGASAEEVDKVWHWYMELEEEARAHIDASGSGPAALAELERWVDAARGAAALDAAVEGLPRPVEPEQREALEALGRQWDELGEGRRLLTPQGKQDGEALLELLNRVREAERACRALPVHLPGQDCAAHGDWEQHRLAAEEAVLACGYLDSEARGLLQDGDAALAAGQYAALMDALGYQNQAEGVTAYGLAEYLELKRLDEHGTVHVALQVARSLPEAGLEAVEEQLREEAPALKRAAAYDVRLEASVLTDSGIMHRAQVQPAAGHTVTLMLPLGQYDPQKTLRVYHFQEEGAEEVTAEKNGLRRLEWDGTAYVCFETGHLSHFVLYQVVEEPQPEPTVPWVSGTGGSLIQPKKPQNPAVWWADIHGHWAEAAIWTAAEKGLLTGRTMTSFAPDAPLTRAEAVTALWKLAGEPEGRTETGFQDLRVDRPLAWAAEAGIARGDGGGFAPDRWLTRQEAAVFFFRCAQWVQLPWTQEGRDSFEDEAEIADWAVEGARFCEAAGIMTGRPGRKFAPEAPVSRGEMAAMLERFLQLAA